eukprot:2489197-Pyramimonas_sp.AAC.1
MFADRWTTGSPEAPQERSVISVSKSGVMDARPGYICATACTSDEFTVQGYAFTAQGYAFTAQGYE